MDTLSIYLSDIFEVAREQRFIIACILTSVCGIFALRRYAAGGVCRCRTIMTGKTVLITGANTGIGKETARDLARRGARVLLACRDMVKAEKAAEDIRRSTGSDDVVIYNLDLASLTSVRKCAEQVINNEPRLDVLINNAGVMIMPYCKTEDGFEMQFGTNHLGHFLLTNLLLDLLKKSAPSRIINVSSSAHRMGHINFDDLNGEKSYSRVGAYAQSKAANILFTRELSKRLKGTGVTANSLHPGLINTELLRHAPLLSRIIGFPVPYLVFKTVAQGAQTTIHCAVSKELDGVSGKYFSDCVIKEEAPQVQQDDTALRLWKISAQMTKITDS